VAIDSVSFFPLGVSCCGMAKRKPSTEALPPVLPTSPLSLECPFCKAKPGRDCSTSSGGFSVVHVARIKAAAAIDKLL